MKKKLLMPIIILAIFATFIGLILYTKSQPDPHIAMTSRQLIQECTTDMATQFHIHSHIVVIANKTNIEIPANIGIDIPNNCMSSLHTHDANGIIHIEAPVKKDFLLDDFFFNWKKPFNKDQILDYKVDQDHGLKFYVNGKESTDFEKTILAEQQEIFINYYNLKDGPDALPKTYEWPKLDVPETTTSSS